MEERWKKILAVHIINCFLLLIWNEPVYYRVVNKCDILYVLMCRNTTAQVHIVLRTCESCRDGFKNHFHWRCCCFIIRPAAYCFTVCGKCYSFLSNVSLRSHVTAFQDALWCAVPVLIVLDV